MASPAHKTRAKTAPRATSLIQHKLQVGAATDRFEAEADRVADHAMRKDAATGSPPMLSSLFGGASTPAQAKGQTGFSSGKKGKKDEKADKVEKAPPVQRKANAVKSKPKKEEKKPQKPTNKAQRKAASTAQSAAKKEEKKPKSTPKSSPSKAQRKATSPKPKKDDKKPSSLKSPKTGKAQRDAQTSDGGFDVPAQTEAAINRARSGGGMPLPGTTRSFMENRIGHDFSDVKIHDNSNAHSIASDLNAKAFTIGHDIFFGQGQYRPGSDAGKRLIAHELAHTVQQKGGSQSVQSKRIQRNKSTPRTFSIPTSPYNSPNGLGSIDFSPQGGRAGLITPVSYTHLTLPTILLV